MKKQAETANSLPPSHQIGLLNEKPLHAALKVWYAETNDQVEVKVDGFIIDIVQADLLVEIQTRNFSAMKRKLIELTKSHAVRLVHPIAREKWIVKLDKDGQTQLSRRKSPKKESIDRLFDELIRIPQLILHPNFTLEVLFTQEEDVRRYKHKRRRRSKQWVTQERRLLSVVERRLFQTPADFATLLPSDLVDPFTTIDLAKAMGKPRQLAGKMAYCLREMGVIVAVGKKSRSILYTRSTEAINEATFA